MAAAATVQWRWKTGARLITSSNGESRGKVGGVVGPSVEHWEGWRDECRRFKVLHGGVAHHECAAWDQARTLDGVRLKLGLCEARAKIAQHPATPR